MMGLSRILSCLAHHRPHRLNQTGHRISSGVICSSAAPSISGNCLRLSRLTFDVFEERGSFEPHLFSMPVLAVQRSIFVKQFYEFFSRPVYFR